MSALCLTLHSSGTCPKAGKPLNFTLCREGNAVSELKELDQRLMDGMEFCQRTYGLFEKIRCGPNGVERLRLRKEKTAKKLIEELIPIARFIQMTYGHGRKIKVKWVDGNQNYDAYLLSSGYLVEKRLVPRKQYLEVTTAVHSNDHLARRHLNTEGFVFGVRGISVNKKAKKIMSAPYVYTNWEVQDEFAELIRKRIEKKANIKYPRHTSLVIQCMLDMPFIDYEWEHMVEEVKKSEVAHAFWEIFLFESNFNHFTTLYGKQGQGRRPQRGITSRSRPTR